ncbi:hypothetical protein UAW_01159 [Enterococcus haemoperoxidus ATCC BAA-382]|uniref:DUF1803 domain-containing protein n=1 Tax=Enterococcus haemoperoxidus ATCC BAA-382 TaxID=1158608 RepID=R2QTL9_9ENTE|nr:DUF1803 domain-containing protein [Enterococcus haemoperoxidus]EOH98563.1 hypothetical protein UAW_01159 [Enterococcus haemoperoxidus ATCC BAA-382]EOT62254.1 hypothetical protein I583_01254 [Enterococcus haemoperoxidus ATCC BAA-382]OJG55664.1 hypothetical protein RV06_GL001246 [Enterococcus haemoperoxidus]
MEFTSYYFASNKNEEDLNKLICDPLFAKIVEYLSEHKEQEVILRQIKAAIPTDSNLELYLDKLIKYNLLERKNRRYSLTFPIYTMDKSIQLPDSITRAFRNITQESSMLNNCFVFGEWLWMLLFEDEQDNYFFGVKASPESQPIFRRREEGNDSLRFVSIYTDSLVPLDLANYFNLLSRRKDLPQNFEVLQNVIGDVDINYFIPQIQKVIRSIKRNKTRVDKQNIFQEALIMTGDLKRNTENQLFLAVPIIDSECACDEIQTILDKLQIELPPLWKTIHNQNQRIFFKQQLYSVLFKNCLPELDHISYFKL